MPCDTPAKTNANANTSINMTQQNTLNYMGVENNTNTVVTNIEYRVSSPGAKSANTSIKNLATSLNTITNAATSGYGALVQLQQITLSITKATWAYADAVRVSNRFATQNYALDTKRAEVQLKLAERQRLITQRTGRKLDVEMADIQVQLAARDVERMRWQEQDKRREMERGLYSSGEQLSILEKQRILLMFQMISAFGTLTAMTLAQAAAAWTRAAGETAASTAATMGVAGPLILASIGAAVTGIAAYQAMSYEAPKAPSAETGYGDVKQIQQDGIVMMHKGEMVHQPGTDIGRLNGMGGQGNITINVYSSGNAEHVANIVKRRLSQQQNILSHTRVGVR